MIFYSPFYDLKIAGHSIGLYAIRSDVLEKYVYLSLTYMILYPLLSACMNFCISF